MGPPSWGFEKRKGGLVREGGSRVGCSNERKERKEHHRLGEEEEEEERGGGIRPLMGAGR